MSPTTMSQSSPNQLCQNLAQDPNQYQNPFQNQYSQNLNLYLCAERLKLELMMTVMAMLYIWIAMTSDVVPMRSCNHSNWSVAERRLNMFTHVARKLYNAPNST